MFCVNSIIIITITLHYCTTALGSLLCGGRHRGGRARGNWCSICRLRVRHGWLSIGHGRRGSSRGVAIDRNLLLCVAVVADTRNPGEGPEEEDKDDHGNEATSTQSVALAAACE